MMVRLKPLTLHREPWCEGIGSSCALVYLIAHKHAQGSSHAATELQQSCNSKRAWGSSHDVKHLALLLDENVDESRIAGLLLS
jgi:hypothetical protein